MARKKYRGCTFLGIPAIVQFFTLFVMQTQIDYIEKGCATAIVSPNEPEIEPSTL